MTCYHHDAVAQARRRWVEETVCDAACASQSVLLCDAEEVEEEG
jgi:hypothetical protein